MKPFATLLAIIVLSLTLQAQRDKDIPGWGKIDKAELELKDCEFEKGADAMILVNNAVVEYQRGSRYTFAMKKEYRSRIKIFKEAGFKNADIKIRFYSSDSYEKLMDVEAVTYNLDASGKIVETKVDKKSFIRQKFDEKRSTVTFTFPEVKPGSVLEYRYTLVRDAFYDIDPWIFQDDIPTKVSALRIAFPEYFVFTTQKLVSFGLEEKKEELRQTVNIAGEARAFRADEYYYKMKSVPSLKFEPFMGAYRDYLQRVEFQLSQLAYPNQIPEDIRSNWPALAKSLLESDYFGVPMKRNLSVPDDYKKAVASAKSDKEKMLTIFKYVQKRMNFNGIVTFYCENAKSAWDKKSGSVAEINIILINLLKDAGLTVYPILASTRFHGRIVTAFPFLEQFNEVLVYVGLGEEIYILDASDKYNPAHLIPNDVLGTEAFVVDLGNTGFITLWDNSKLEKHMVAMSASIDDKDILNGEATLNSFDYAKNPRLKALNEGKEKFASTYIHKGLSNIKVDTIEFKNVDEDAMPLEQKFKFSLPVTSSGDYKYFTLNLFTGLDNNPFTADTRQSSIEFGANQHYTMVGSIAIPQDCVFEQPPTNVMMIMPDTSIIFRRLIEVKDNRVSYRITLDFRRPYYEAQEYPAFKDFYKKLYGRLNEQIVYKKKSSPNP
jgi:uncharacterized protein DUF3857